MTMTISGDGTISGLVAGGLPNATVQAADLAANAVDAQALSLLNASGSAPVYACRAWVNFNGTGTVAINASGNVSSITDNGTGDYTVNYTSSMPDANYVGVGGGQGDTTNSDANRLTVSARRVSGAYATGSTRIVAGFSSSGTGQDGPVVNWAVFR